MMARRGFLNIPLQTPWIKFRWTYLCKIITRKFDQHYSSNKLFWRFRISPGQVLFSANDITSEVYAMSLRLIRKQNCWPPGPRGKLISTLHQLPHTSQEGCIQDLWATWSAPTHICHATPCLVSLSIYTFSLCLISSPARPPISLIFRWKLASRN
jgi:hypothetical protein